MIVYVFLDVVISFKILSNWYGFTEARLQYISRDINMNEVADHQIIREPRRCPLSLLPHVSENMYLRIACE
jgi:hypothetical protein